MNQKRGRNVCIADRLTSISLPDGLFLRKHPHPSPSPTLWSSPLARTLNPTTSITYWTEPLTNPTTSFQLSSPNQDTCDSRRCSTQLTGAGAGALTAHSPSDSTMKQSTFNRAEEPPGKFTANSTSPWPGTPLLLDHPLSSTKHRHRYPSQNPPHLRKWDSPIPTSASSSHLTSSRMFSSPKAQGLLLCHAEPGYPLVHLL